ncbi:MAG TPA: hypothetical protein VGR16_11465 [Thermomicrobiales bacterium]|nr:hypothetical protein [Thermomicrobiales bacterium]
MTTNKPQKQAIRARMAKTGERYTTARHFHLGQHLAPDQAPVSEPLPEITGPRPRVAEPGMSDTAIQRGSGKSWDEWFRILDAWGAEAKTHRDIARHLVEHYGVGGWWAQSVTVGYERARSMRSLNERADGFMLNASKTFPVPVERLFKAFSDELERDQWLEPGTLHPRTARPFRSARFDVPANGTRIEVNFTAKGESKASAAIQHLKLLAESDVDWWRTFWKARLERLEALLAKHPASG